MQLMGDLISSIARGLGIRECDGCKRRKAKLNAAHKKLRGKGCPECAKVKRVGGGR